MGLEVGKKSHQKRPGRHSTLLARAFSSKASQAVSVGMTGAAPRPTLLVPLSQVSVQVKKPGLPASPLAAKPLRFTFLSVPSSILRLRPSLPTWRRGQSACGAPWSPLGPTLWALHLGWAFCLHPADTQHGQALLLPSLPFPLENAVFLNHILWGIGVPLAYLSTHKH